MAYSQITFAQLVTALSIRLSDPNKVFWIEDELKAYLKEALRTWQAFAQYTSDNAGFNTVANTTYYDLFSEISKLAPTITDRDLIEDIERHLQETISSTVWAGTEQFTLEGITQAIQKRRDRFLIETGMVTSVSEVAASTADLILDDNIINVRRALWKSQAGVYNILWPADTFMLTAGSQVWTTPDVPVDFTTYYSSSLDLLLAPPPAAAGFVHLLSVNSGPDLNPASSATILGIPDDLCWVVKFGALADLFGQDGPGQDVGRAKYCESRWSDGIKLARISNYVQLGYQAGTPSFINSLEEQDTSEPDWVNSTAGAPVSLSLSGNIAAVNPKPDGVYALSFQIVPKAVLPSVDGDMIQVGQEIIDVVLDYAQHLANIKESAADIQETMSLYQNFVKLAAVENDILRAKAVDFDVLQDRSTLESKERPRRRSDITLSALDYPQE
jgi:hypothetical protein